MAKRKTSRMAWGLSWLLALVLAGGLSAVAVYGRQTGAFTVEWQPIGAWRYWWVGKASLESIGCGPAGSVRSLVGEAYSLGLVELHVPYRQPKVICRYTFPESSGSPAHYK